MEVEARVQTTNQTVHTNPHWLADLVGKYHQTIIAKCSERVRDAVEKNEDIKVKNVLLT